MKQEIIQHEPWNYRIYRQESGAYLEVICGGSALYKKVEKLSDDDLDSCLKDNIFLLEKINFIRNS